MFYVAWLLLRIGFMAVAGGVGFRLVEMRRRREEESGRRPSLAEIAIREDIVGFLLLLPLQRMIEKREKRAEPKVGASSTKNSKDRACIAGAQS